MEASIDLLISKRDYDYAAFTKKIIGMMKDKLTRTVNLYLQNDREVKWVKVEKLESVENYIIVYGQVETRPGDMLNTADGQVLLTNENVKDFTNTIRFFLNTKVVMQCEPHIIVDHIKLMVELAANLTQTEFMDTLRREPIEQNSLLKSPELNAILEKITRPKVVDSFDAVLLSDEQVAALRLTAGMAKGMH